MDHTGQIPHNLTDVQHVCLRRKHTHANVNIIQVSVCLRSVTGCKRAGNNTLKVKGDTNSQSIPSSIACGADFDVSLTCFQDYYLLRYVMSLKLCCNLLKFPAQTFWFLTVRRVPENLHWTEHTSVFCQDNWPAAAVVILLSITRKTLMCSLKRWRAAPYVGSNFTTVTLSPIKSGCVLLAVILTLCCQNLANSSCLRIESEGLYRCSVQ